MRLQLPAALRHHWLLLETARSKLASTYEEAEFLCIPSITYLLLNMFAATHRTMLTCLTKYASKPASIFDVALTLLSAVIAGCCLRC